MHITLEADYAIRILDALNRDDRIEDAKHLAEQSRVTLRFTLKILHKLASGGLVRSYKGKGGGYCLAMPAKEITLYRVIELIDGPVYVNRCLSGDGCHFEGNAVCGQGQCKYHLIFDDVNEKLVRALKKYTIASKRPNRPSDGVSRADGDLLAGQI